MCNIFGLRESTMGPVWDLEGAYVPVKEAACEDEAPPPPPSKAVTALFCGSALLGVLLFALVMSLRFAATVLSWQWQPPPAALQGGDARCGSFMVNLEVNNLRDLLVPQGCEQTYRRYTDDRYFKDNGVAFKSAALYIDDLAPRGDGSEVVVTDVDETMLSNLPYYAQHGYGTETYNASAFNAWVLEGAAPAFAASLAFFNHVRSLDVGVVLLTGRDESQRNVTARNLAAAGYHGWLKLLLRSSSESGMAALEYKSGRRSQLQQEGYQILTCVGDQWSDITGPACGDRSFKIPNPMYYIS